MQTYTNTFLDQEPVNTVRVNTNQEKENEHLALKMEKKEGRQEEAEMEKMEGWGWATYLLGHSVEEVAVSALLLPCPHEARLLSTRRSGAELHGARACSLSAAANDAYATQTTSAAGGAAATTTVATWDDARANASCVRGSVSLSWRWPGRLWVSAGLWWDRVTLTASHIQLCLLGLRQREGETEREGGRDVGVWRRREEKEVSEGGFFWGYVAFLKKSSLVPACWGG